jgi:hypothetical protein
MVRQDQGQRLISFPFTAGCKSWVITGRSSDLSRFLKPSHSNPGRDYQNSGTCSETLLPKEGKASQQRELLPIQTAFPVNSTGKSRYTETNDEVKVRNKTMRGKS